MANILADVWGLAIERPLDKIGLMQAPGRRFIAFTGASALILWIFKPQSLFDKEGKPYKSALYSGDKTSPPLDWGMASLLIGALSVIFI